MVKTGSTHGGEVWGLRSDCLGFHVLLRLCILLKAPNVCVLVHEISDEIPTALNCLGTHFVNSRW